MLLRGQARTRLKRYERRRFGAAADTNRATSVCSARAAHTPEPSPGSEGARPATDTAQWPATDTAQSPGPASRSQVEGRGGWAHWGKAFQNRELSMFKHAET